MLDGNCNDDENSLIECCHRRTGGTLINRHLMEVLIGVAVQTLHSYLFCKNMFTFISIPTCIYKYQLVCGVGVQKCTTTQLSFLPLTKALLDSFVQKMQCWCEHSCLHKLETSFSSRGNLRALFNCLYDWSDQTQTVTT